MGVGPLYICRPQILTSKGSPGAERVKVKGSEDAYSWVVKTSSAGSLLFRNQFNNRYFLSRLVRHTEGSTNYPFAAGSRHLTSFVICSASELESLMLISQQTRDVEQMLVYCWADVVDGGPTMSQH